jgi:hypothetical protein
MSTSTTNDVMNAAIAAVETVADAVHTGAADERTGTINIDESDVSVANTNADTGATNEIAAGGTANTGAAEDTAGTIAAEGTADTGITVASNEGDDEKEREREDVVTVDSDDDEVRFDDSCGSKNRIRKRPKRKICSHQGTALGEKLGENGFDDHRMQQKDEY